jgi:arylsulfatase
VPAEFHQTTWATECALEFLDQAATVGKPWMLNINPYDPHPPFVPPREYADRFNPEAMPGPHFRESDLAAQKKLSPIDFQTEAQSPEQRDAKKIQALYYAMIALIDDQLARIIQHLDETGQRENTVIIFTSDHGESLGDHGLLLKGCRFYEGLVRVPLIFNCPGTIASGTQSKALVELLDMSATILDLAGVTIPDYFQGRSLTPILSGELSPHHHRGSVHSEYFDALAKQFCAGNASFATMYRTARYKLVTYHRENLGELFDLENDPHEFENLWDHSDYRELKAQLVLESFNSHVMHSTDVGSRRIAGM